MQGDFLPCWTQSLKKCHVLGKWPETLWKQQKSTAAVCEELLYLSRDGVVSRSRNLPPAASMKKVRYWVGGKRQANRGNPEIYCKRLFLPWVQLLLFKGDALRCPILVVLGSGIPRPLSRRYASLLPGYAKMMAWFWMMFGTGNLSLRKKHKICACIICRHYFWTNTFLFVCAWINRCTNPGILLFWPVCWTWCGYLGRWCAGRSMLATRSRSNTLTLRYLPMKACHVIAIATNCTVCRVAPARRSKGGVALLPTPPTARHLQCKSGEGAREGAREGTKFAALEGLFEVGLRTGTRLRHWRRISRNASKSHGLKRQVSLCEELGLPVQLVQVSRSWFPSCALRRRLRVGDLRRMAAFRGLGRRMFLPFLSVRVWRFLGCWVSCILGGSDPLWQAYREDFFGGHTLVNLTSSCSDSIENSAKQRMTDIYDTPRAC